MLLSVFDYFNIICIEQVRKGSIYLNTVPQLNRLGRNVRESFFVEMSFYPLFA